MFRAAVIALILSVVNASLVVAAGPPAARSPVRNEPVRNESDTAVPAALPRRVAAPHRQVSRPLDLGVQAIQARLAASATPAATGSRRPFTSLAAAMSRGRTAAALMQEPPALSTTGLGRRTKLMIYLGVAAGFIGAAYAVDHGVEDVTPSTLGTRED